MLLPSKCQSLSQKLSTEKKILMHGKNSNKCMWFAVVLKVESQLFSSLSWRYQIKMTWHLRRSGQEK